MKKALFALILVSSLFTTAHASAGGDQCEKQTVYDACLVKKHDGQGYNPESWTNPHPKYKQTIVFGYVYIRKENGEVVTKADYLYSTPHSRTDYNEKVAQNVFQQLQKQNVCP